mmetsp:Transcript_20395/g.24507  ORF Transcript_20395/g.24507 Transcript_20395/m.24507 type:complete len:146 (+) Transcript_20395:84-521(+)
MMPRLFLITLLTLSGTNAFAPLIGPSRGISSKTELYFGIPSFLTPKSEDDDSDSSSSEKNTKDEKTKISKSSLLQLITAGAGSPFLGDFEGVDEETGNFMFSLEANNLVDEKGQSKQTQMPYFESGWVDEEEEANGGGFKWPWDK